MRERFVQVITRRQFGAHGLRCPASNAVHAKRGNCAPPFYSEQTPQSSQTLENPQRIFRFKQLLRFVDVSSHTPSRTPRAAILVLVIVTPLGYFIVSWACSPTFLMFSIVMWIEGGEDY